MRLDLPSLRALEAFEALGRCGTVAAAARELGLSPGGVSQHIKSLELTLGRELVVRKANGLTLTVLGERYHHDVSACLEELRRVSRDIRGAPNHNLVISALPLLISRWLAPAVLEWQKRHPGIGVCLESSLTEPCASNRMYDFRITYANRRRQMDRFAVLFTDSLTPAYNPKLLLTGKTIRSPAELLRCRLLSIDWSPYFAAPPSWQEWFGLTGIKGKTPTDTVVFSHSSLAVEAALNGYGVALVQYTLIAGYLEAGLLVAPFTERLRLPSPYVLAWGKAALEKKGAREMCRWIIDLARACTQSGQAGGNEFTSHSLRPKPDSA